MNEKKIFKFLGTCAGILFAYETWHFFKEKFFQDRQHKYEMEEESLRFRHTSEIIDKINITN